MASNNQLNPCSNLNEIKLKSELELAQEELESCRDDLADMLKKYGDTVTQLANVRKDHDVLAKIVDMLSDLYQKSRDCVCCEDDDEFCED